MVIRSKSQDHDIPVIYISSKPDIKILAKEAGADVYLMKQFGVDELKNKFNPC